MSILVRSMSLLCAVSFAQFAQAADHIFADSFELGSKIAQADVEQAFTDDTVWATLKTRCDNDLNDVINDIYAGFDWRQAAHDYGLCYNVGTLRGDPKAPIYSKKAIAMLKTLARSFPVISPRQNHQFLAFGNGTTKVFTLPMTPLPSTTVSVFSNPTAVKSLTYNAAGQVDVTQEFDSGAMYPILRISNSMAGATSNAAAEYTKEVDWHVSFRDQVNGDSQFNVLHWLGAHHPAGAFYISTIANQNDTAVSSGSFSVSGTTLTFTTAPAAGTALFVQYVGNDYTQTSNFYGGVESVKPDGPGYNMRAMSAGLAYGYDVMRSFARFHAGIARRILRRAERSARLVHRRRLRRPEPPPKSDRQLLDRGLSHQHRIYRLRDRFGKPPRAIRRRSETARASGDASDIRQDADLVARRIRPTRNVFGRHQSGHAAALRSVETPDQCRRCDGGSRAATGMDRESRARDHPRHQT